MALYEVTFITRQDFTSDDVDSLSQKLQELTESLGAKIVSKEYWGLRKLAYIIKKNSRGHYVLLNIDGPHAAIAELKRVMSFNENIIRSLIVNVKKHENESPLFVSRSAKEYDPSKVRKKEPSELDSFIDQLQFEI